VAYNLVLPQHARDVFTHPMGLFAYFITFGIVSMVWVAHNRLFANYFVRKAPFVFLNFVLLAFTVLLVYMLQVFMRFGAEGGDPWGAYGYFGCLILVYGLLASLFAMGVRARWAELDARLRHDGIRAAVRTALVPAGTLIGWPLTLAFGLPFYYAPLAVFPLALVSRIVFARFAPKIR